METNKVIITLEQMHDFSDYDSEESDALGYAITFIKRMQWQPIESAPLDGTLFLAINAKDGSRSGVCLYDESDPLFSGFFNADNMLVATTLTHWMPLPDHIPDVGKMVGGA